MRVREIRKRLRDEYGQAGFYPSRYVAVAPWDLDARIIRLTRRSKKRYVAVAGQFSAVGMTARRIVRETCRVQARRCLSSSSFDGFAAAGVAP